MKRYFIQAIVFTTLISTFIFSGCLNQVSEEEVAQAVINETKLEQHILKLASDEFMGRQPFTEGEEKTINYIKSEFEKIGLEGGNNGNYFQKVPMVEITSIPPEVLEINIGDEKLSLSFPGEYVASTVRITDNVSVENADLVFAGYGIVAPEYNWNDYKGLDVKGKIVIVLVNDPGFATRDSSLFKGHS